MRAPLLSSVLSVLVLSTSVACSGDKSGGAGDSVGDTGDDGGGDDGGDDGGGADGGGDDGGCPEVPFYLDADGDGFGDADQMVEACEAPDGHVDDATDCDDTRADVHPGATDTCEDLDCSGTLDSGAQLVPSAHPTLKEAVDAIADVGLVCVEAGTYADNLIIEGKQVSIVGAGVGETVLETGAVGNLLDLSAGAAVTVSHATLRSQERLAMVGQADVVLQDVAIDALDCPNPSGCVGMVAQVTDGTVTIERAVISGLELQASNDVHGGLIYAFGSAVRPEVVMRDVVVEDNVFRSSVTAKMFDIRQGALELERVRLENNEVDGAGGAAIFDTRFESIFTATDVDIIDNVVLAEDVGAQWLYAEGPVTATRLRVLDNSVDSSDGYVAGFYVDHGDMSLHNAILANNIFRTYGSGGYTYGLFMYGGGALSIDHADIVANTLDSFVYSGGFAYLNDWEGAVDFSMTHTNVQELALGNGTSGEAEAFAVIWDGTVDMEWNNIWGVNYTDMWWDGHSFDVADGLSLDALYVDRSAPDAADWDLRLQEASPSRDAGDAEAQDHDGTRADIGAYGGAMAWTE